MCFKFLLKKIIPCPDIKKYKRFLFISAHACDIEKGAGATASKFSKEGKDVKFAICTDSIGLSSNDNFDIAKEIHEKESLMSAAILGVKEIEFLKLECLSKYSYEDLLNGLIKLILNFKPEVVFIDDVTTYNEINPDDRLVTKATEEAILSVSNKIYMSKYADKEPIKIKAIAYYNTIKPNYYVGITGYTELKMRAILAHNSLLPINQTAKLEYIRSYKSLMKLTAYRDGFKSGKWQAEGFRVVSILAIHNMPQINY